jgi:hypothetical protein
MTDAELIECAAEFREGILDGSPSFMMCAAVCWPLAGFLRFSGVDCDTEERKLEDVEFVANHVWIRLADGRVLDPTADQFDGLALPPVYLGKPLAPIHRPPATPALPDTPPGAEPKASELDQSSVVGGISCPPSPAPEQSCELPIGEK